ncbi:42836_t:CDS:1 [Gigaspora margarita]|uniref:42836_t:CDS:1 n=1 Tax=Gigaspora margarita TaxID=4874 RepID=A0ABM8W1F5_GIGMA|nr:42836_t:CDS:1 [Gigaspora margarita]
MKNLSSIKTRLRFHDAAFIHTNYSKIILILFKSKIKLLLDNDELLEESDNREIKRLINEVIRNQTYSKKAKLIFKNLVKKCKEYGYEPVQLNCRICKRYDYISYRHLRRPIDFVKAFEQKLLKLLIK